MKNTKRTLLAAAVAVAISAFAGSQGQAGEYQASTPTVTTSVKAKTFQQSSYTVGTRRVGMVGNHPYPLIVSHYDSSTVKTSKDGTVSRNDMTTTTSQTNAPFSYTSEGGTYYTNQGGNYYGDEGLNIVVRNTGRFNN